MDEYRRLFPVTRNWIYFNHAATAPYSTLTAKAMDRYIRDFEENGSANYKMWEGVREETRGVVGKLLSCRPGEVAITANTSEGANIVANGLGFNDGDNLVVPAEEFPANLFPWLNLEKKGVEVRVVPLDEGRVTPDELMARVDGKTRLVAVSSVAYHNGFRLDLETLGCELEEKGIPLYVDAIQSLGVIPMDVDRFKIAFLSSDGHKWLLGPEGAAIFYVSDRWIERLDQAYLSWLSVRDPGNYGQTTIVLAEGARRFECGTPNFAGIAGLNQTCKTLLEAGIDRIEEHVLRITRLAAEGLRERGFRIISPWQEAERSGIVTFNHPDRDAESLRNTLVEAGVQVAVRGGGIRISPHFYNNEDDVEKFLSALA